MKKALLGLCLCSLFQAPTLGQGLDPSRQTLGRVSGRVEPTRGEKKLPQSIMVTLSSNRGFRETHIVEPNGAFEFVGVPAGYYMLALESPGRQRVETAVEVASGLQVGHSVFVSLDAGAPLQEVEERLPAPTDKTRSVRWMQLPEEVRQELETAERASAENQPKKAVKHLKKALQLAPDLYHAHNNLAVEYLKLGKTDEAIRALEASIEINPQNAVTYRNLGGIYLEIGRPKEALPPLQKALELDSVDGETFFFLGEAFYTLGDWPNAATHLEKAAQLRADPDLQLYLGNCYLQLRRFRDALREYRRFLEMEPQGERADGARGLIAKLQAATGSE